MIKKSIICIILTLFLINLPNCVSFAKNKELKPLKLEQNAQDDYKYGNLGKTMKNPQIDDSDDFSNILDKTQHRKEPSVLDVFNALVFVIFLILLTGWGYMKFKRVNPQQLLNGKFKNLSANSFKIISSLQLGAGKSIYLIEINNKQLIVGTTSTSVNLLAQMDKVSDEAVSEIPNEAIEKLFEDKTQEFKKLEE